MTSEALIHRPTDEGWILSEGVIEALDSSTAFEDDIEAVGHCYAGLLAGSSLHAAACRSHFIRRPEDLVEVLEIQDEISLSMAVAIKAMSDCIDWQLCDEELRQVEQTIKLLRRQLSLILHRTHSRP